MLNLRGHPGLAAPQGGCPPPTAQLEEIRKQRGAAQPGPPQTVQKFQTPLVAQKKMSQLLPIDKGDTEYGKSGPLYPASW